MAFWSKQNGNELGKVKKRCHFSRALYFKEANSEFQSEQFESIHKLAVQESSPKRYKPFKVLDSDSD